MPKQSPNIEENLITKFYETKLALLALSDEETKDLINSSFTIVGFQAIAKAIVFLKKIDQKLFEESVLDSFLKEKSTEEQRIVRKYGEHFIGAIKRFILAENEK